MFSPADDSIQDDLVDMLVDALQTPHSTTADMIPTPRSSAFLRSPLLPSPRIDTPMESPSVSSYPFPSDQQFPLLPSRLIDDERMEYSNVSSESPLSIIQQNHFIPSPRINAYVQSSNLPNGSPSIVRQIPPAAARSEVISSGFSMPEPNLKVESAKVKLCNPPPLSRKEEEEFVPSTLWQSHGHARVRRGRPRKYPQPIVNTKPVRQMSLLESKLFPLVMEERKKNIEVKVEAPVSHSITPVYPVKTFSRPSAAASLSLAPENLRPTPIVTSMESQRYIQPTPMLSPRSLPKRVNKEPHKQECPKTEKDMLFEFPLQLYRTAFSSNYSRNLCYLGPNNVIVNEKCTDTFFRDAGLTLNGQSSFLSYMKMHGWYRLEVRCQTYDEGSDIVHWMQFVLTDGLFIPNMSESDIILDGPKCRKDRARTMTPSIRCIRSGPAHPHSPSPPVPLLPQTSDSMSYKPQVGETSMDEDND